VLDEPTTGLHMSDVAHLLAILDRLVDGGNSVIVIEHNMDVVRRADWIIDLGPEGGSKGGRVVFEGTPTSLLKASRSLTSRYLQPSRPGRFQ
jgi:excinuclease UvrABC ATPase subunit